MIFKILIVAAPLFSFAVATHWPVPPVRPDFDRVHGAFTCLGDICRTKAGMLPVAWRRYGQYKDRSIWD